MAAMKTPAARGANPTVEMRLVAPGAAAIVAAALAALVAPGGRHTRHSAVALALFVPVVVGRAAVVRPPSALLLSAILQTLDSVEGDSQPHCSGSL